MTLGPGALREGTCADVLSSARGVPRLNWANSATHTSINSQSSGSGSPAVCGDSALCAAARQCWIRAGFRSNAHSVTAPHCGECKRDLRRFLLVIPSSTMATKKPVSAKNVTSAREGSDPELVVTLKTRFEKHSARHPKVRWGDIEPRLTPTVLATLEKMEQSGGQPDVALIDSTGEIRFVDCAEQSPSGRRSLCYDKDAWTARKEARPSGNVIDVAKSMGVELLTESEYRALQQLGSFDSTTSSWVVTPTAIRALGGALFCDRRYEQVFVYHNGAQSYYAARGFRAKLRI